jgi:hypothetical protein
VTATSLIIWCISRILWQIYLTPSYYSLPINKTLCQFHHPNNTGVWLYKSHITGHFFWPSKWLLSIRFLHQNSVYISYFSHLSINVSLNLLNITNNNDKHKSLSSLLLCYIIHCTLSWVQILSSALSFQYLTYFWLL